MKKWFFSKTFVVYFLFIFSSCYCCLKLDLMRWTCYSEEQVISMFSHYSSFIPLVLALFVWGTFVTLCVTVTNICNCVCANNIFVFVFVYWGSYVWNNIKRLSFTHLGTKKFIHRSRCTINHVFTSSFSVFTYHFSEKCTFTNHNLIPSSRNKI